MAHGKPAIGSGSTPLEARGGYILARMRSIRSILVLAVLLTACTAQGATTTTAATTTTTTAAATTTTPPADLPICLAGDLEFDSSGVVAAFGEDLHDAVQIASIRHESHEGCERLVVGFLTGDGAPAAILGPTATDFRPETGIVRITLPEAISASAIVDTTLDGAAIRQAFVVRTRDGNLAIDIHLAPEATVAVRSEGAQSPAQVIVDVKPDPDGIARLVTPAVADNIVVLSPGSGPITYPITVTGYARTFEATVVARLWGSEGIGAEQITTAADSLDVWGEFALTITDGPTGTVTLFVGEDSAQDGTEVGVRLGLEVP